MRSSVRLCRCPPWQVADEFETNPATTAFQVSVSKPKGRRAFQTDLSRFRLQLVTPFCAVLLEGMETMADAAVDALFNDVDLLISGRQTAHRQARYALHWLDQAQKKARTCPGAFRSALPVHVEACACAPLPAGARLQRTSPG